MGHLHSKSQLTDYTQRGHDLQQDNIISFFLNTFETRTDEKSRLQIQGVLSNANTPHQGRPRNDHVPYLHNHPEHATKIHVRQ